MPDFKFSPGLEELRVVHADAQHALGVWAEFMLLIWRSRTEMSAVARARQVLRDLGRERRGGVGCVAIVEQTALPPETEVRRELAAMLASGTSFVRSSSVVHEGSGFKAATVRGVVTALSLFDKYDFPHVVHGNLSETAEWHVKMLGKPASRVRPLCEAIEDLRAALDVASGRR